MADDGDRRASIHLAGLSYLDKAELEAYIDDDRMKFHERPVAKGTYGEPATLIGIALVSVPVIKGIIAWLLKSRHHGEVEKQVEYIAADGATKRTTIRVRFDSSTAPEQEILAALGSLGVEPEVLSQVAGEL